jgi:4-hydroxy-tetrahydrodipicolinate synthase
MKVKVYSASITPFLADGSIDCESMRRLVARAVRHNLDGMFVAGSMGEWFAYSLDEREKLIRTAQSASRPGFEILAGIHAATVAESIAFADRLVDCPVAAYVLALPKKSFCPNPMQHLAEVAVAVDKPVYYYHCPSVNGIDFSFSEFAGLVRLPNIAGIKNSASHMRLRKELLMIKAEHDFVLLEGNEWAVDEAVLVGCDGVLCGSGALCGRLLRDIADAAAAGDVSTAVRRQRELIELFHAVYSLDISTAWVGEKYALYKLGAITAPLTKAQSMELLTPARMRAVDACIAANMEALL